MSEPTTLISSNETTADIDDDLSSTTITEDRVIFKTWVDVALPIGIVIFCLFIVGLFYYWCKKAGQQQGVSAGGGGVSNNKQQTEKSNTDSGRTKQMTVQSKTAPPPVGAAPLIEVDAIDALSPSNTPVLTPNV